MSDNIVVNLNRESALTILDSFRLALKTGSGFKGREGVQIVAKDGRLFAMATTGYIAVSNEICHPLKATIVDRKYFLPYDARGVIEIIAKGLKDGFAADIEFENNAIFISNKDVGCKAWAKDDLPDIAKVLSGHEGSKSSIEICFNPRLLKEAARYFSDSGSVRMKFKQSLNGEYIGPVAFTDNVKEKVIIVAPMKI